jgi:hypothetical protein
MAQGLYRPRALDGPDGIDIDDTYRLFQRHNGQGLKGLAADRLGPLLGDHPADQIRELGLHLEPYAVRTVLDLHSPVLGH